MTFVRALIITMASFLLGTCVLGLAADWDVLYSGKVGPDAYNRAESYYLLWWNASMGVKALLHAVILLLAGGISVKVASRTEQALYFNGGSLVLFIASLAMYGAVMLPAIQMLVPVEDAPPFYHSFLNRPPMTRDALVGEERDMNIQILCASNTLIIGALVGIIALQGGDWIAEKQNRAARANTKKKSQ